MFGVWKLPSKNAHMIRGHSITISSSLDYSTYTANVLSAEYTDVCLRSKFKNKHWLFLHVFVCNGQQIFSCCFYFESNTKFTEK